jgi:hypothetical protein
MNEISLLMETLARRHHELLRQNLNGAATADARTSIVGDLIEAGGSVPPGTSRDTLRNMLYFWAGDQESRGERANGSALPELKPFAAEPVTSEVQESLVNDAGEFRSAAPRPPWSSAATEIWAAPSGGQASAPSGVEQELRAREILRVEALAHQWLQSNKDPGYLLRGSALKLAKTYRNEDIDIAKLVDASEESETAKQLSQNRLLRVGLGLAFLWVAALIGLIVTVIYYRINEQSLINAKVKEILKVSLSKDYTLEELKRREQELFRDIQFYENFGGAEVNLRNAWLPQLPLHNFSFDNLRFIESNINGLDLSSDKDENPYISPYVFNDSTISNSFFNNSNLSFSQFRGTILVRASFADANLYRASFDYARLCDVDFAGSSLLRATFWNSTIDRKTIASLRSSSWWLANGWTAEQIDELVEGHEDGERVDSGFAKFQERRKNELDAFIDSKGHTTKSKSIPPDIVDAYSKLVEANASKIDFVRALALNGWAWSLTINGLNRVPENWRKLPAEDGCSRAEDIPKTALDAANQALCLADKLSGVDPSKVDYTSFRSSIEDTIGYILLQKGDVKGALAHLKNAAYPKVRETRDALFRLAIAENVSEDPNDRQAALSDMQMSIEFGYVPTHERALVSGSLKQNDFAQALEFALQGANRPRIAPTAKCPG